MHRGDKYYNSTFSLTSALGEGGWSATSPSRFTSWKQPRGPFYRKLIGPHGRSGLVWQENLLSYPGFEAQNLQSVALLLYRLRYPDFPGPYTRRLHTNILGLQEQ